MEISAGGETSDPFFSRLMIAQVINRLHGGAVVSAWDVDMLDEATVDAVLAYEHDLPQMQVGRAKIEGMFAAWEGKRRT